MQSVRKTEKIYKIVVKFVKFNAVGTCVAVVNLGIFALLFNYFGESAILCTYPVGAVIEFTLLSKLNKTRKGNIFGGN